MEDEKRKQLRFECCLPAEFLKLEGEYKVVDRVTVRDFTGDGLKLVVNFNASSNIIPGSKAKLRLYCPEKNISCSLQGEIAWSKCSDNRMELGLKIKKMDKELKSELLNWIFPKWIERNQKRKKH
ncbi:MAG: PilZ domain-containing protein [Candidatus Aminicenantes bacterium]|nr:PilZ domain-containing protein [Candidatus Aminicenantes bacterium]MBL7082085.1 PilZ domain-containing protein [Candidatus Aminicenantes bacterium]